MQDGTAKVVEIDGEQYVLLPPGFLPECGEVNVTIEGGGLVLGPILSDQAAEPLPLPWPV